jgi:hypothetical protein
MAWTAAQDGNPEISFPGDARRGIPTYFLARFGVGVDRRLQSGCIDRDESSAADRKTAASAKTRTLPQTVIRLHRPRLEFCHRPQDGCIG